jgi:hypothetical protein
VNDYPTQLLSQRLMLGDNPDDVRFEVHNGHALLILGTTTVALPLTAQAAAHQRARTLREVA